MSCIILPLNLRLAQEEQLGLSQVIWGFLTIFSFLLAWPPLFTFINFGLLLEIPNSFCSPFFKKLINGFHFSRSQCQKCACKVCYLLEPLDLKLSRGRDRHGRWIEMLRSIKSVLHQSGFFDTNTLNVPGNSKVPLPDSNFFFFCGESLGSGERSFNIICYYCAKSLGNWKE